MNTFCADCCGWHPVEDDCVMKILDRFEAWLRRRLTFRELGWEEIGEKFTRFVLFKCRWFSVYLHKLDSPVENLKCHDHPWHFWAFVLWGGYFEEMGCQTAWRPAGSVLYRTARSLHNTVTRPGSPNWSIVVASRKVRPWGFLACGRTRSRR